MRRSWILVGVVVLVGTVATLLAWRLAVRIERDQRARVFAEESAERVDAVRQTMRDSLQSLVAVGAFWRASEEVTASEFASFARTIRERHGHLERLAWVPRASRDGGEVYEARFVEPPELAARLADVDLGFDPERRRAFEAAAATGREQLTGPVQLLFAPDSGEGILGVFPVRRSGAGSGIEGFAVGAMLVDRLLDRALGGMRDAGVDVELVDGGPTDGERVGRPLGARRSGRSGLVDGGSEALRQEASFDLAGRTWIVRTAAASVDSARGRSVLPASALAVGLLATTFVVAIVRVLARKNAALEREATERRRAEEARLALERQMFETQKLESLGTFAGGVAHDFNNILTGILGNADLALRKLEPGHPASECLNRVVAASERAATLTGQLLDYVGRSAASRERIDLGAIVRDLGPLLLASIPRKVVLRLELGEDLPRVDGDPTQIRQVVANLVANGAEACDAAGGTVVVRTSWDPAAGRCVLEVDDSGSGIDAETLARIFDPFFTTKFTGRGLGLAAVHGIVRAHGGSVHVDSRPGKGTSFRVEFPCAPSPAARLSRRAAAPADPRPGAILVVDDEPVIRELARAALEGAGFRVLEASDGSEAVSLFLERREDIRLLLTDMTMPRMHGDEALAAIRAAGGEVPAVLMTGYSEGEAAERFEALGLRGILKKPFLRADLLEKVRAALS